MSKAFLLVYSDALGSREQIKQWANTSPLISMWRYDLPSCFYLVSDATADEITIEIQSCLTKNGRFIVAEISGSKCQGWLSDDSWYLINNLELKPTQSKST
jgi:hypothetical protein